MKKLTIMLVMVFAVALYAKPAFAHKAKTFEPGPGCMGRLTSFHAQDPEHGLRHTFEYGKNGGIMPHKGIADELGVDPATNFQEFMKLNQMWCKSYKDDVED